jgi:hypothetical protein
MSDARPCLHRPSWREHLTPGELAVLERLGWLHNEGRADWYPCGGHCPEQSERRVLPEPLSGDRWQTECPAFECLDEVVAGKDLEQLSAQGATLALWLRERLRGSGPLQAFERPGLHGLGRVEWRGQTREGVLVTGVTPPDLPLVLRELQDVEERWFVFVPEQRRLPAKLRGQHGPRAAMQVVGLDEWLDLAEGNPALRLPMLEVREPAAPTYAAEPIVAEVFEATGKRGLSRGDYTVLIKQHATFDLFIDATAPGTKRGCSAAVRDAQGRSSRVNLSAREVAVLAELVRARGSLRVGAFRSVKLQSIDKLIERARRKLEGNEQQGQWRFVHTLSGVEPSAKSFLFKPQEGLSFAIILPLPS